MQDRRIHSKLMYIIWCVKRGREIKLCETHADFRELVERADTHFGDCTQECNPCARCEIQELEIEAQNALDNLRDKSNDMWCGGDCLLNCMFESTNEKKKREEGE